MSYQGQTAGHSSRGQRLHQPSRTRESRKPAHDEKSIVMCDGTPVTDRHYQHLRSTAHQKFLGSHAGCAEAVRRAIPKVQWTALMAWMNEHRPRYGNPTRQNDGLMATLIGHAAHKSQQSVPTVFQSILTEMSAHVLLPSN